MPSCEAGQHLYGNRGFCVMCKSPEPTSALLVPDWVSDALANISTSTRQRLSFADIHAIGNAARKATEAELTDANARIDELEALNRDLADRLNGMTLDSISASNMRHVITRVAEMAEAVLDKSAAS